MKALFEQVDRLLSEAVHRIELYHGTSLKNAKNIMKTGLTPAGGEGWGEGWGGGGGMMRAKKLGSLYFTGEKGTAARYAKKFDVPVVLKVVITKPERVNKIAVDPADDPLDNSVFDNVRHFDESPLHDLAMELNRFAKKRGWGRNVFAERGGYDNPILPDFEFIRDHERALKRFNLYKSTKKWLETNLPKSQAKNEYRNFLRNFRPGEYGYVHIRNNGSLRIDSNYLADQHQLMYPDELPPASIKEVWVEVEALQESGVSYTDTVAVPIKRLASEIRLTAEWIADVFDAIGRQLNSAEDVSDLKDVLDALEEEFEAAEDEAVRDEFEDLASGLVDNIKDQIELGRLSVDRAQELSYQAADARMWALDIADDHAYTRDFAQTKMELGKIKPEQLSRVKAQ